MQNPGDGEKETDLQRLEDSGRPRKKKKKWEGQRSQREELGRGQRLWACEASGRGRKEGFK